MATSHPRGDGPQRLTTSRAGRLAAGLWRPRLSDQSFLRLFEVGLAGVALLGLQKMVGDLGTTGSATLTTGLVVLFCVHIVVIIECLRPFGLGWVITLASAAGIVLVVAAQVSGDHTGPVLWRIDAWLGVPLAFLAIIHPRGPKLPVLAIVGVGGLMAMAATGAMQWGPHLLATFFTAVQLALLVLGRWFVMSLMEEHLRSHDTSVAAPDADEPTRSRAEAVAAVRRDMHDSLLHCLQRISSLWHSSTPEQIRAMCADTLQRLAMVPQEDSARQDVSLRAGIRAALVEEPCAVEWTGDIDGVPPLVAEALEGAVREAVRNVVKHSDSARARIQLLGDRAGLAVVVTDEGPGFDVAAVATSRSGIRESVIGRMAGVGGMASINSHADGTTVTLVWPAPLEPPPHQLSRRTRGRLVWTPLPLVVGSLVNVLAFPVPDPTTAAITWAVVVGILAVASVRLGQRGLSDTEAWALCGVGLAAYLTNLVWIDPATMPAWAMWLPSLTGGCLFLALPGRRVPRAVAMAGTVLVGSLLGSLLLIGFQATLVTHFGALMAVLVHTAFPLVLAFGAAGVSRHVHVSRRLDASARQRARTAVERDGVWRAWLHRAHELSGGFLDDVATGRRDPTSPDTRREAAWLEGRMRDELRLWPSWTRLAERLDDLRRRGWRVRLDIEAPSLGVGTELIGILERFPEPGPHQSLTVTERDGRATCTVSDPGFTVAQLEVFGPWETTGDPDFTQIRSSPALVSQEPS